MLRLHTLSRLISAISIRTQSSQPSDQEVWMCRDLPLLPLL